MTLPRGVASRGVVQDGPVIPRQWFGSALPLSVFPVSPHGN